MDLKEDPDKRKEQIDALLDNRIGNSQDRIKLYDKWSKYYEQVSRFHVERLIFYHNLPFDFNTAKCCQTDVLLVRD